ncbi:MAG: beta-lactamase family protein [Thermoanaerobaculia bacterium]|nr:beta-lactamase family protein [Thermoanaerobaculia bacterium]
MELRKIPGLAWAVVENGELTRQGALGLADVENSAPVTARSIFAIASLDKQLTATGAVKAAQLGKLSLDDPIAKWADVALPGVTLRHLLAHTSGLPDVVAGGIEGRSFSDYTTAQLLDTVRGLPTFAPPGHRYAYSDAGLFLAQLATENAAGEPWWEFMRREVFAPAGVSSAVSMAPDALLPGRVLAYTLDRAGELRRDRRLDFDFGPVYTDLGMTVADFARFLAAHEAGRIVAPAGVSEMTTPQKLADGTPAGDLFQWSRYGLGVGLDDFLGEPLVLHSGHSGVGFARFPKRRLSVVVFTNLEHPAGSDPVGLALGIAGLVEPALSLAALPVSTTGTAETAQLRAAYEELLAGSPALDRYTPTFRTAAWEGSLAGRFRRWGALSRFELVRDAPLEGERSSLFRATHERATAYVRFSYADGGAITRVVWWHP